MSEMSDLCYLRKPRLYFKTMYQDTCNESFAITLSYYIRHYFTMLANLMPFEIKLNYVGLPSLKTERETSLEFFLNVLLNSLNSVTNIFVITVKGLKPATQPPLV